MRKLSEDPEIVHQKIAEKCELEKDKPDGNSLSDHEVNERDLRPIDGNVSKELEMDADTPEEAEWKDDAAAEEEDIECNDVSNYIDGMGISPVCLSTGCILARHYCVSIQLNLS